MFEGFERTEMKVPDRGFGSALIHYRIGGEGPPLLLLHGNPLSHVSWHKIANRLAKHFTVVAADLRGYGDSVGPEEGGEKSINYSFRAMGQDQVDLMEQLGFERFLLAGHDRGGRTAHRICVDHPDRIEKATFIDILPNRHVWHNGDAAWAKKSWHWLFMIQPYDFPERMMASVPPDWYMEKKIGKPGIGLEPFPDEVFQEYVRCFTWKTIRGSCEDYRACATCDLEMDDADFGKNKVQCPTAVIWGAKSHTGTVWGDLTQIWKDYVDGDLIGGGLDCGHYVPEEDPDGTFDWLMKRFKG
ncbi:MAG: alpha/beta hydrolase [Acetobacterales bacterium]